MGGARGRQRRTTSGGRRGRREEEEQQQQEEKEEQEDEEEGQGRGLGRGGRTRTTRNRRRMGRIKTKWVRMRWRKGIEASRRVATAPTFRLGLEASGRDKKSGKKTRLSICSLGTSHQPPAAPLNALRWLEDKMENAF